MHIGCRFLFVVQQETRDSMPRQTNSPASRERRLRRLAERKGLLLRKIAEGRERGRFYVVPIDAEPATRRHAPARPTMTLEEAEALIDVD